MFSTDALLHRPLHSRKVHLGRVAGWGSVLLALGLLASTSINVSAGAANDGGHQVSGGGKTIIEGGGPGPVPVTTVLAFHANSQGGAFECLALMPPVVRSKMNYSWTEAHEWRFRRVARLIRAVAHPLPNRLVRQIAPSSAI